MQPALHQAIQALHAAIAEQQDRGDKVLLAQALQIALKVQANDVSQGEGARGGMQQGPPQGQPQQGNPIAALIAARMAGGQ